MWDPKAKLCNRTREKFAFDEGKEEGLAARNPTALTLGYARTLQRGAAWLSSNALPDIAKRRWHPIGPTDRTCKPASLD
ncbi:hypothetical protein V1477_005005 [Vespula maculifrons]|uniref:Uncharacterized protein n=2 Tax=Vespula TaxID=7451 RepID=A0A834NMC0_VESGE|nr:hypothetical protein HZH68_002454 [Vespula germanica]